MPTVTEKILKSHIVSGAMIAGEEVSVKIDSTLTQDATGTMAYLQFEAIGIDHVKTESSVSFIDHNTIQNDFRNADDHRYLQSIAKKFGIYFSRPGNGSATRYISNVLLSRGKHLWARTAIRLQRAEWAVLLWVPADLTWLR